MRIVCQKCAAAYAIDDRVITPKGVRAQCPRCRHLQLVKREESAAPAAAPATPAPKPAVAAKPAAALKPANGAAARPATPSASLTDSLFGDLGDLAPPEPTPESDSLFGDLAAIGNPTSSPLAPPTGDSLFGELSGELTESSPSNPTLASGPAAPSYAIPSGDLLFDDIAPPPPAPVPAPKPPQPKPAAPMAKPAAPAPKPAAPAAPALSVPSEDSLFDFNAPPGFSPPPPAPAPKPAPSVQVSSDLSPFSAPAEDALFDFNAPPGFSAPPPVAAPPPPQPKPAAPVQARPSAPAAEAFPAPADDPFASFSAQAEAPAPEPQADPLLDFFGAPPSQPAPVPAPAPARAPVPVAAPAPAATPVARSCRECGKPLVDPFDQALGACEDCRQHGGKPSAPPPAARSVEVLDLPPLPALGDSNGVGTPALSAEPRSGQASAAPTLSAETRSAVRGAAPRTMTSGVAVTASSGRGRGALMGALVLLLVVGGAGAAYMFVPQVKEAVGKQVGSAGTKSKPAEHAQAAAALPPAVETVLPRWQLMFLDAGAGDSKQLLAEGQSLLAKDQRLSYSQAAESFQRALVLDPKSDAAIGGYVQAIALGQGARMDDLTFQEARSLIEAAETRSSRGADLLVAHANLLLARAGQSENLDQARKLAEEVLANPKEGSAALKAEAHLVLGRVFLTSSRELANQHFDSALAIASDLQRVHYFRALADETAGDYPLAIDRLQKRLTQDPDHWETRATLARIYLEVGDVEKARQLYESRLKSTPGDLQSMLALAVIRYQVEGGVPGALGALRGLVRNRDKYDGREMAEVLVHLATVERLSNNLDAAAKAARESLEAAKNNPAAHLQLFLIDVARKDAASAATHLEALKGHLEEPVMEKLLEGRLKLLERKPAEAMERFMEASRMDPRRADALMLAGVAAAQDGRRDEAFRVLAQVLQADPLRLAPRPIVTSFYLRSGELLLGLEGSLIGIARGSDDILATLYEGLLRYHQGDAAGAEKLLKQVAELDGSNAPAFAYRTFIALGRKDMNSAKAHAAHAVAGGRQVAIAHLAQGYVLAESKQVEPAKKELRDAVTLSPKLYAAEVKLDELEGPINRDAVRERLVKLLGIDPSYLPAKRTLYLLDKRG